jgi:lipopolysaccharide transport system ATP-binding protein
MSSAIRFDNVSKAYRLGQSQHSLREAISRLGRDLVSRRPQRGTSILWALRDVSFDVTHGTALGVIGPNGAGKTTTLRLLSEITQPTSGHVAVDGRVSALIELGAGFHPDLTGRENINLNAAILGMPLREVEQKFDQIVAFSGLEQFIDTPVKRYSSGMYVRLGFSIAAHLEPDVLLVDEVLAVGDARFRQQCIQRIEELRCRGTTIVFVSHNLYLVESVCDQAVFLADGHLQAQGNAIDVINAYEAWMRRRQIQDSSQYGLDGPAPVPTSSVEITKVEVQSLNGSQADQLNYDDALEVRVHYHAREPIHEPNLYVKILRVDGTTCCMVRSGDYGYALTDLEGEGFISLAIDPLQLAPAAYVVDAELVGGAPTWVVWAQKHSASFQVAGTNVGHEGVFVPRVAWIRMEKGE